jgi:hypothetical protein
MRAGVRKLGGKGCGLSPGGSFGFCVTLPAGFTTGQKNGLPPAPECFPKNNNWNLPFNPASQDVAGTCYYLAVPQGQFCSGNGSFFETNRPNRDHPYICLCAAPCGCKPLIKRGD